jgi:hypothetical protein
MRWPARSRIRRPIGSFEFKRIFGPRGDAKHDEL